MATVVPPSAHPEIGSRILIRDTDDTCGLNTALQVDDQQNWRKAVAAVREQRGAVLVGAEYVLSDRTNTVIPVRVFLAHYAPVAEAWIFGAGHIALALAPVLSALDWHVIVCDDRAEFVSEERFPTASALRAEDFERSAQACAERSESWVVLVTRGHQHDEQILRVLARHAHPSPPRQPRYIGMIGSKRRVTTVRKRLQTERIDRAFIDSIHAPIGLPLGADTPAEIAVSIAAEMIAIRRGYHRHPETNALELSPGRGPALADTSGLGQLWKTVYEVYASGKPVVLATVIDRRGSAPRGIGAQMAVFADGTTAGTIGGGCGEAEVLHAARRLIVGAEHPPLLDIDLTGDDASETGDVCGGRYTVLLETLTT